MSWMSVGFTHSKVPTGAARPIDGVRTVNHLPPMAHHHAMSTHNPTIAVPSATRAITETSGARRRCRRGATDDVSSGGDPRGSWSRTDGSLMARGLVARHGPLCGHAGGPDPGRAPPREACARA